MYLLNSVISFLGPYSLIVLAFWAWMMYDCLQHNSRGNGRYPWIWILLWTNAIGAAFYFFIEWLPRHPHLLGNLPWVNRGKLQEQLRQAESDVKNIGNAYQYVKLGKIHYQLKNLDEAIAAYQKAIEKEPKNIDALWGLSGLLTEKKEFEKARATLEQVLAINPEFAYGDASFEYALLLNHLGDGAATKAHLETHVRAWSHPPAHILLAEIYQQEGQNDLAQEILETMIARIKGSARFQYQKNKKFIKKAEMMLKEYA